MPFTTQFGKYTTLSADMSDSETSSATLASAAFTNFTGDFLVLDYNVPAKREVIQCTVTGTAISSITRGQDGTSAVAHSSGAAVMYGFLPDHYARVSTRTLGYTEITTSFTTTAVSTVTDVTSLSATVTVPTGGARVRITVQPTYILSSATAGTTLVVYIREGSTVLNQAIVNTAATSKALSGICIASFTATAGSHTYKASVSQDAAGTMTFGSAGATGPAFILVENIE